MEETAVADFGNRVIIVNNCDASILLEDNYVYRRKYDLIILTSSLRRNPLLESYHKIWSLLCQVKRISRFYKLDAEESAIRL